MMQFLSSSLLSEKIAAKLCSSALLGEKPRWKEIRGPSVGGLEASWLRMESMALVAAAFSVLGWMRPFAERLPAPTLSLDPQYPLYTLGEEVTLSCSALEGQAVARYRLYKKEQGLSHWQSFREGRGPHQAFHVGENAAGEYSCSYLILSQQWIESPRSNIVRVAVRGSQGAALLPVPELSLPSGFSTFSRGERVWLECTAPAGEMGLWFYLYRLDGENQWTRYDEQKTNRFEISTNNLKLKEAFVCSYQGEDNTGRRYESQKSTQVVFSVIERPPAPTLSLDTQHPFFILGEEVTLVCSAPEGQEVAAYSFSKQGQSWGLWQLFRDGKRPHQSFHVDENAAGQYRCQYQIQSQEGRWIQSLQSNKISITVREHPPAPVLSLDPQHPFYILGEEVTLNCSAPEGQDVLRYRFHKGEQLFSEGEGPHEAFHVGENATGKYSCMYWILSEEGWEIHSVGSDTISIDVRDRPPAPVLTVDPPSGVVREGETLLLTCSSNGNQGEKSFYFYKDGAEMNSPNQGSLKSSRGAGDASSNVSLRISLQVQPNHTGEFACMYEERMDSRWIMSFSSQKVNITVSSSIQNSSIAWLAVLCVIPLVIPFAFCFRKKNCASKSQRESEPGENQKNTEELQMLESKAPTDRDLQGSEVTYTHLAFPSAPTYSGPVMESGDPLVEEEGITYSEILFRPINKAEK